jgi:acyl-CoA synthetase (AMP-forming)/AMP-acid ligase II
MEERIWHKAYAQNVPPSIDYEKITLGEALERTSRDHPDTVALIMMGKKITYRELNRLVDRFASALARIGVEKGDHVAVILPNIPQVVIASYAIFRLGAVVVMHNPLYTESELQHQLNDSGCRVVICLDLLIPRIQKLKDSTSVTKIISRHIRDYRSNWFLCVPTIYVGCLNHPDFPKTDFSSVKGSVSGAAPLAVETEAAIRDGWFFTGDIGYMDDDGYLFIVDRKKDMIIAGGYNIYSREIDEVLFEHPAIQEGCAIGIPDQYRGETVKAFVVKKPGHRLDEDQVISLCKEKLAVYKIPK